MPLSVPSLQTLLRIHARNTMLFQMADDMRYLAVLAALDIPHGESRNAILVDLSTGGIKEGERSIASLLWVISLPNGHLTTASSEVVLQSDVQGEVGRGVQSARALVIISSLECVLEHPVGAARRCLQATCGAVAGVVDPVAEEEVDFGHNTSDINAREVSNAAAVL